MTKCSRLSFDHRQRETENSDAPQAQSSPLEYSRRDTLRALGKYSALVGTVGVVVLSAEEVVAQAEVSCAVLPTPRARQRCLRTRRRQDLRDERLQRLFDD